MMNIKHKITVIVFSLMLLNVSGQETEVGSKTEKHKVYSQDNDEYILRVTFPRGYDSKKEYKTLYYLDAYWLSEITLGSYTVLNLCNYVENVIFVGVSLNGSEKDWHTQRDMDFTPSPFQNMGLLDSLKKSNPTRNLKISLKSGSGNELTEKNTGGADLFLDFLENKVVQFVEKEYPNLNKRRGLLGHSFGGLFGFYTLENRPQLFQDYILISASLSWNSFELVDENTFLKLKESENVIKLYHSYGEDEIKPIKTSNIQIKNIITDFRIENLNYQFSPYKNTNHHSVLSRAIYDGLLYVYKKNY